MAEELIVNTNNLETNLIDMGLLKTATENYISELTFEKSKGSSINGIISIHGQLKRMQTVLTDLYANTEKALMLTKKEFNDVDNYIGNYFKELGK